MKRFILKNANLTPHFIGSWKLEHLELCDEIIKYFEINIDNQKEGRIGGGLNQEFKKSVDITVLPKEINLPKNQILNEYIYRK